MESSLVLKEVISHLQKCFVSNNTLISRASQGILQRFLSDANKVVHCSRNEWAEFQILD